MVSTRPTHTRGRVKTFGDRYPWLGPTIWTLSAQYFLAQIVVAAAWHSSYSLTRNTISDLGNTVCGQYGGSYVCSPRHSLMNASFIALGFTMAVGSLLIYQEFTEHAGLERIGAFLGFSCLAIAGLGTFFVGTFPENTVSVMHVTGAGLAIGVGNVGILVLGLTLTLPRGIRVTMMFLGAVSIVALVLFATHSYLGIGAGSMERVAAYPETLWLIGFGLYTSRNHFAVASTPRPQTPTHRLDALHGRHPDP